MKNKEIAAHDAAFYFAVLAHLGERDPPLYAIRAKRWCRPSSPHAFHFIIFGNLIGSRTRNTVLAYMQFIVPGPIMMAVITNPTRMSRRHFLKRQVSAQY